MEILYNISFINEYSLVVVPPETIETKYLYNRKCHFNFHKSNTLHFLREKGIKALQNLTASWTRKQFGICWENSVEQGVGDVR